MSISIDRRDTDHSLIQRLPQIAASVTLATAAILVASVDYRQAHWEWVIWPRFLQASVLLLVSVAITLTLVPRRSWFTRCFAYFALGLAVLWSLRQVNHQLPAILWPNTLLVVLLSISGVAMLVFHAHSSTPQR